MTCGAFDPISCAGDVANNALDSLAKSIAGSASWAVKTLTTSWLGVPSPDVTSVSTVGWLQDRLSYFVLVAMFCSILYAAYRMATTGTFEDGAQLGHSLLRLIVVSGCVGAATTVGLQVGDEFSRWILGQTPAYPNAVAVLGTLAQPAVVMLLGIVVILAQVIQLFLMLLKNAMCVALVAFIPLTSAATNTPAGKQGFLKAITWLCAMVLYKPVAAVVYVIALRLSIGDASITGQLAGIAFMLLAIFALPALMKFLVPLTVSVAGGNAGAMAGAAVGAALATGAVIATGGASAGAGGFAGAAGPSGATGVGGVLGGSGGASGAINAATTGASAGGAPTKAGNAATNDDE